VASIDEKAAYWRTTWTLYSYMTERTRRVAFLVRHLHNETDAA
jgi:hypothetical protein